MGMVMYAGVDYEAILRSAEQEADVVIWDGGNNDFPFFAPDLLIVVADPLRPGHELLYHPGETNLRMADVVVINKVDSAEAHNVEQVVENVTAVNPMATIVFAKSPPTLDFGPGAPWQARARRRRRPDADPRRDAVRRRSGRRPQRRRRQDRRPAALRGRLAEGRLRQVAAADERPAGDGLLRRAAARAGADDQRRRLRRRRHRHADRPDAADRRRAIRSATRATSSRRSVRRRSPTCSSRSSPRRRRRTPRRSWPGDGDEHDDPTNGVWAPRAPTPPTPLHAHRRSRHPQSCASLLDPAAAMKAIALAWLGRARGRVDRLHLREAFDANARLVRRGDRPPRRDADRALAAGAAARPRRVDRRHRPSLSGYVVGDRHPHVRAGDGRRACALGDGPGRERPVRRAPPVPGARRPAHDRRGVRRCRRSPAGLRRRRRRQRRPLAAGGRRAPRSRRDDRVPARRMRPTSGSSPRRDVSRGARAPSSPSCTTLRGRRQAPTPSTPTSGRRWARRASARRAPTRSRRSR